MGWFFKPQSDHLWNVWEAHWYLHSIIPAQTRTQWFLAQGVGTKALPLVTLQKATVNETGDCIRLIGYGSIEWVAKAPSQSIEYFLQLQFAWDWELEVHPMGLWQFLLQELHLGNGFAMSDGSFRQGTGAAVWIIEGSTSQNWIVGESFVLGSNDDHSLFQSGLMGIFAVLLFLYQVCQPPGVHKPRFQLACDGKSVLHWLWHSMATSPTEPHYDLLSGTRMLLNRCGYNVQLVHVLGHQDIGTPAVLSWEALLNIEADALAKHKLTRYTPGQMQYTVPFSFGGCYLDNHRVVKI